MTTKRQTCMTASLEIETIEEIRHKQGIDDVELRLDIRELQVGDFVRISFLSETRSFETVLVRLTRIRGLTFRGKLVKRASRVRVPRVREGEIVTFSAEHIHSVLKRAVST